MEIKFSCPGETAEHLFSRLSASKVRSLLASYQLYYWLLLYFNMKVFDCK